MHHSLYSYKSILSKYESTNLFPNDGKQENYTD